MIVVFLCVHPSFKAHPPNIDVLQVSVLTPVFLPLSSGTQSLVCIAIVLGVIKNSDPQAGPNSGLVT